MQALGPFLRALSQRSVIANNPEVSMEWWFSIWVINVFGWNIPKYKNFIIL